MLAQSIANEKQGNKKFELSRKNPKLIRRALKNNFRLQTTKLKRQEMRRLKRQTTKLKRQALAAKDEAQAAKTNSSGKDRAQAADDRTKATEERCILLEKELADLKAMMLSYMAAPPPPRAPSGVSGFMLAQRMSVAIMVCRRCHRAV